MNTPPVDPPCDITRVELKVDRLAAEGAELQSHMARFVAIATAISRKQAGEISKLQDDVERLKRGVTHRPRRRQGRRKGLTTKQREYLDAWTVCNENNAAACRLLKIAPSSGQQQLRLCRRKAKAFGLTIGSLNAGPAPSRANRLPVDHRGADLVPDRSSEAGI